MVKLSDYVIGYLADYGVRHIFMVTGGGAMHLNDSIGKESRIQYICNHHEQACAMAAEGYARVSGKIGVICVTTGPGGINALNGVFGAWTDSIPMLIISGQVKRETCMAFHDVPGLRQLGDQEADIISMVKGITKYAVLVREPESIRYHLEKAFHLATTGRPGPCWLDIPLDVQGATIDPAFLESFSGESTGKEDQTCLFSSQCVDILQKISTASRPVLLAGNGIRAANVVDKFRELVDLLRIPVASSRSAADILPSDHEFYFGRSGIDGQRAANFVVQNSDLLLCVGTRLSLRQTGYNVDAFARNAFVIQVDIDLAELSKPTAKPSVSIQADAKSFVAELLGALKRGASPEKHWTEWLAWCNSIRLRYPNNGPSYHVQKTVINPYHFIEVLFKELNPDDLIVCGNGSAFIMPLQVGGIKDGQRLFFNSGCASMGYDLPAAIGAAVANLPNRTICLAGDGSFQMNVQELQTLAYHRLPIKIFVLDNGGYLSIRQTQKGFFGRLTGEGPSSGVGLPDFSRVAAAYGVQPFILQGPDFKHQLRQSLNGNQPSLSVVRIDPKQGFEPRASSKTLGDGRIVSAPLEDMYPFLSRAEFAENMIVPIWGDDD